jgi:hypothetical protein
VSAGVVAAFILRGLAVSFRPAFWQRERACPVNACFSFMVYPIRTLSFERPYHNLGNIFNLRHGPFSGTFSLFSLLRVAARPENSYNAFTITKACQSDGGLTGEYRPCMVTK